MGVFRDMFDIAKDANVKGELKDRVNTKVYSSVSKRASEGTLQFPVLTSKAIDIETMQIITKALERNYATFVQVAVSMSSIMDVTEYKNAASFLKQFHQNTGIKFDYKDAINMAAESYSAIENDNLVILGAVYEGSTTKIVATNKEQLIDLMEDVRTDILNHKYTPKVETIYNFSNPELSKKYNGKFNKAFEAKDDVDNKITSTDLSAAKLKMEYDKFEYQKLNDERDAVNSVHSNMLPSNVLKDNDVKKANELIATTLHIRLKLSNKDGIDAGTLDFIIGVKCTMHPIKSEEVISNMVMACRNNNKAFNFLRWTTGEISFFKDFLFNIKETKDDVVSRSKGASPWWITLKRRRALAKIKDATFSKKRLLPNATIVLSMEEVEMIKSEYGYDLFNPLFTNKIMETFFLLGIVVVDNSAQIAHFLFDGHTDFQSVSFSGLEKENSNNERKFKEMLKVINRN